MMRGIFYSILALLVLAVGWLSYAAYTHLYPSSEVYGAPFKLTDMKGQEITEQAMRGNPSAVFFGFTHCPEVCPTTLYELNGWLEALGPEASNIKAFFISVDPERDTPELLNQYISNVSSRIMGITGDPESISKVIKAYRIYAKKIPTNDGDDYTMDHTASILLLNKHGGFEGTIAYGENSETAMEKLRRLASG